ncbi:ABC transporter permease subunit [Orbaceae bacterium ac157xtp]
MVYITDSDNLYQQHNVFYGYLLFFKSLILDPFILTDQQTYSFADVVTQVLFPTFQLCLLAILCAIIIGFPIGIRLATTKNSSSTIIIQIICLILYACPIIWLALLLTSIPYFEGAFNHSPIDIPTITGFSLLDILLSAHPDKWSLFYTELKQLFLPVFVLTIQPCIATIQTISQHVSNVNDKNFIKVAKIRENSPIRLLLRHILPNAIPEAMPQLAYNATTLLFSTMVVEILFEHKGLGVWVFTAFTEHNYYFISLAMISCGILISLINLLSELIVVIVSPVQIRSSYE